MGFVDTLMAGRYSSTDLAAVALGSSIWLPAFLASQGILMATTPIVAHLVGGNQASKTHTTLHQGGWIALVLCLLSMLLLHNSTPILIFMGVEASLATLTAEYLFAVSWGFPALLLYQLMRSYIEGFGKTQPAMKIAVLGLLCNIPLNYLFIYGKLGFPELGGVGCGWATAIVMWVMFFAASTYLLKSRDFAHLNPLSGWQWPKLQELKHFMALGLPIGLALLIEVSMFSVIALLLADLGKTVIAAHQVTISFTGLIFMLPLSISLALTIRIGHRLGEGNFSGTRETAISGFIITLTLATLSSSLMALLATDIASMYSSDLQVVQLASGLLVIAALFQFSDAIQVTCAGALRGYKDTQIPLLLVFIAYWVIGLPSGYLLAKTDLLMPATGAWGFWVGLLIGLTIGAILLLFRLHLRAQRQQI